MPSHEKMISQITEAWRKQKPRSIDRITGGVCNEVYRVGLENEEVIIRLSPYDRFLMGSHDHIPQFQALKIRVPDILAEDYSKQLIPLAYQVLSKIEGQDLGDVIETLSKTQLTDLAKEIASIFNKVKTIPSSDQFGVIWGGGDNELSDTWTERMKIWIEDCKQRGLDQETEAIADQLFMQYQSYFASVKPTTYYGDISYKNVMILDGKFNGLVDLDGLTQGDPLEGIGRIKIAWYGKDFGDFYALAVMDALKLNSLQRKYVTLYGLLNQISLSCDADIQFNQNAPANKQRDKTLIKRLAFELNL